MQKAFSSAVRGVHHFISAVVGFTLCLIGLALLVLPGPGILIIIVGLMLLAGEFVWARHLLRKVKKEESLLARFIRRKIISFKKQRA